MSNNAPQVQQQQDDPFTPKEHGGFRRVRRVGRGKYRHWEFRGREQDEVVKAVLRKSKFFLIAPAIPFIASVLGLIVVGSLYNFYPSDDAFWTFLEVIIGVLVVITGVYFLYNDLALWWVETYIITTKRVLIWKGFLSPSRDEFGVERVVQVATDQRGILSLLLNYGNVHLYLVGGKEPVLEKVANPKGVRDLFEKVTDEYKQKNPAKVVSPPALEHPELRAVLTQLSTKEELPKLKNPDEKNPRFYEKGRVPRPLRTFGGPLRLPCNVKYNGDEYTVKYIQRARSVLVQKLIIPTLIFLGLIISFFHFPTYDPYISIAILAMFFVFTYIIINYWDDIYILTSKRIIDINRRFIFLDEEHLSIEYSQIKSVDVKISNPIYIALDVGRVIVETPGNNPNIVMRVVDHPFSVQDFIYKVKDHKEKADKIKNANDRKTELNQWFGTVLATMEKNVIGKGVPNLQKKNLFEAAELASAFGMKVVPAGEDSTYPNIESGLIVYQYPAPGTMVQIESNDPEKRPQINVVLSRHP